MNYKLEDAIVSINVIMARFLDYHIYNDLKFVAYPGREGVINFDDLDYHKNWNTLMEVKQKICDLDIVADFEMSNVGTSILASTYNEKFDDIVIEDYETPNFRSQVYRACFLFITNYFVYYGTKKQKIMIADFCEKYVYEK